MTEPKKPSSPQTVRYRLDPGTLSQVAGYQVDLLCQLLYEVTPLALESWEGSRNAWLNAKDPALKEAHGLILRAQIETLARTYGSIFHSFEKQMARAMAQKDEGSIPGTVENGTDTKPNGMKPGWRAIASPSPAMTIEMDGNDDQEAAQGTVEDGTPTKPNGIKWDPPDTPTPRRGPKAARPASAAAD